ncbi:MAG: sugar kinase [Caulobacter sp.]|nr:sugar kinase [Caulobacter sp.]
MVDLSAEMAELWASLGGTSPGRARCVQFVAARRGEGTSTVARAFAAFAAARAGRTVWLVDLDLFTSPQHAALAASPEVYGPLGKAVSATPADGAAFFTVQPPTPMPDGSAAPDSRFLVAHAVGQHRWWVTRFRADVLRGSQNVHILPSADYWNALKRHADLVVVDCPSADRSRSALTVAPFMDQTVLVVAADQPDVQGPARLRDGLLAAGGRVAGVFFNRAQVEAPGFLRAFLR